MKTHITSILFPTDLSDTAALAVPLARKMAATFGARIHCIHVSEGLIENWVGSWSLEPDTSGLVTKTDRLGRSGRTEQRLRTFVDRHFSDLTPPPSVEVVEGKVHEEIVRVAEQRGAGMIIMGNHGYGDTDLANHDCTTERVIRTTAIPVLSICEPAAEFVRL